MAKPAKHYHRRDTCRLCLRPSLELVLPLKAAPIIDAYVRADELGIEQPSYPLDLALCRECGHVQIFDIVDPSVLYPDYLYETKSSLGLVEHFKGYAEDVVQRFALPKDALAIDIGSNDGTLLRFFKNQGLRVLGIDPAREIALKATSEGIPTKADFFSAAYGETLRREAGPATVVTCNNLFANVDDLDDLISGVRKLLAPDGLFVFESSYLADMVDNMVFDFIYHEHLSYFSVKPVARFMERHGLELIDIVHGPTKGGSYRYAMQLRGGPRKASPAVAERIALEEKKQIHQPAYFKAWEKRIDAAKDEAVRLIDETKRAGKSVCAYGASATTTTLLYHFGVGSKLDCLFDDYAIKQGRFSPGLHLPVVPSAEIYTRKPGLILMAAWRYAEPIIAKHGDYAKSGGRWLIPLPETRLVG